MSIQLNSGANDTCSCQFNWIVLMRRLITLLDLHWCQSPTLCSYCTGRWCIGPSLWIVRCQRQTTTQPSSRFYRIAFLTIKIQFELLAVTIYSCIECIRHDIIIFTNNLGRIIIYNVWIWRAGETLKLTLWFQMLYLCLQLHHITIIFTLFHNAAYTVSDQWCINKVIFVIHIGVLEQVSFQLFLKDLVSVFISSWRLEGSEFHAFGPAYEKALLTKLEFQLWGFVSETVGVSRDRVDRQWLSSCRPGMRDYDRCVPGA